jgi:putative ABC transport system permease protein
MFTGLTVLTLGLGIGANSAIFSVIEGVLLKPLPYPRPDDLITITHAAPGMHVADMGTAPFLYFTWRDEQQTFEDVGIWITNTVSVTGLAEPEEIRGLQVTDAVLPLLGAQPLLGRLFSRADDTPGGAPESVILTYGYWQSKFGGNASVIGRPLQIDGRPRDIIGVLPASFRFLDLKPAIVLPLRFNRNRTFLGSFAYTGLARLKPGATMTQANADVARMIPIALQRFPPLPGYSVSLYEDMRLVPIITPLRDRVVGNVSTALWLLMGTVGLVWLIACANVANLLLVRVEGRFHELAIRTALGAERGQLARELLTESLTLALLGGLLGLALAYAALRLLVSLAPANLPRLDQISLDPMVLLFTLAISIAAGVLFGAIPAIKYTMPSVGTALRSGARTVSLSKERQRARGLLVIVQVALTLMLLISAGLMIRTFQVLRHVQPGFTRPEEVQTLRVTLPSSIARDQLAVVQMEQTLIEKLSALPGVSSVAATSTLPMEVGSAWRDSVYAEDHEYAAKQIPPIRLFKFMSPGVPKTMGNSLVAGRDFSWIDVFDKRPVVMVSENLARELWHDPAAAIGKHLRENANNAWREVVGVIGDERDEGADQPAPTIVFWPMLLDHFAASTTFARPSLAYVLRSPRAGSLALLAEINQAIWSVNPNLPATNVRTLQEIYDTSLARTSFTLVLLAIAGTMALLLGLSGIYAVISYSVSQRRREIGIRVALGAQHHEVTRMFVWQGAWLAGIGIVCGIAGALAVTRVMSSMLVDVSPIDPLTYAGVSIGLAVAAVLACYIPALRATAVDPVEALRAE